MATAAAVAMDVLERGLAAPRYRRASMIEESSARPTTKAQFRACLDEVTTAFEAWKADLPAVLRDLHDAFDEPSNEARDVRQFVGTVIDALTAKIESEKAAIKRDRQARRRIVASSRLPQDEDWFLRWHDQFADLMRQWHNERVNFYYRLLALQADYDPSARGGEVFSDTKALDAFLSSIRAA